MNLFFPKGFTVSGLNNLGQVSGALIAPLADRNSAVVVSPPSYNAPVYYGPLNRDNFAIALSNKGYVMGVSRVFPEPTVEEGFIESPTGRLVMFPVAGLSYGTAPYTSPFPGGVNSHREGVFQNMDIAADGTIRTISIPAAQRRSRRQSMRKGG